MPEEINHDRRGLFGTSAITIVAAQLGIIGSADARSSKDDLAGATPIPSPTQNRGKERQVEHPTFIAQRRSMDSASSTERPARKTRRHFCFCTDFLLLRGCSSLSSPDFPIAIT